MFNIKTVLRYYNLLLKHYYRSYFSAISLHFLTSLADVKCSRRLCEGEDPSITPINVILIDSCARSINVLVSPTNMQWQMLFL